MLGCGEREGGKKRRSFCHRVLERSASQYQGTSHMMSFAVYIVTSEQDRSSVMIRKLVCLFFLFVCVFCLFVLFLFLLLFFVVVFFSNEVMMY